MTNPCCPLHGAPMASSRTAAEGEEPGEKSLVIWTVYEKPSDFPDSFVVRRYWVTGGEVLHDSAPRAITSTLESARVLIPAGLVRMPRQPADDPAIVEVWL